MPMKKNTRAVIYIGKMYPAGFKTTRVVVPKNIKQEVIRKYKQEGYTVSEES